MVAALTVAAVLVVRHDDGSGHRPTASCTAANSLNVVAAPQIAPLVTQVSRTLGSTASGCPLVSVRAQQSAETLGRLRVDDRSGPDDRQVPDVWIPESSLWLQMAGNALPGVFAVPGTSLARSPVVVAMPQPLAHALGWPRTRLGWAQLADRMEDGTIPRFSVGDPLSTTDGMLTVLAVNVATLRSSADPGIAQMRALTLRSRLADANADIPELLHRLGGVYEPDAAVRDVGAFALTEQELWTYDQTPQGTQLVADYPPDAVVEADFPLTLSTAAAADARRKNLAAKLVERFRDGSAAEALAAHGFRPAAGRSGPPPRAPGLAETYPAPVPLTADAAQVSAALTAWARYKPFQIQVMVLVDGSGSMNGPVRDRTGRLRTKADLLRESGVQAGRLFGTETSIGMWEFSTHRPGAPYEEIVPFGPIGGRVGSVDRRTAMIAAASRFTAFPGSGTPMYETVLRATAAMRDRYRPGAFSAVVVLTDGREESSPFELTLRDFLTRLSALEDPQRPVPIFAIGYGADADMSALSTMAKATGGQAVASTDPADLATAVARIFLAVHMRG